MSWFTQIDAMFLLSLWLIPHMFLFLGVRSSSSKNILILGIVFLCLAYVLKPSTSDLPKYSVYFTTGLIATEPYRETDGGVLLDPADLSGHPFEQAFQFGPGFIIFSKILHKILPSGKIFPRIAPSGHQRYVSDAPVLTISIIFLLVILYACLNYFSENLRYRGSEISVLCFLVVILGSVFFMLGSQNTIRQFMGLSFLFLGGSFFHKRMYSLSVLTLIVAITMHHWIVMFCVLCAYFVVADRVLGGKNQSSIRLFGGWRCPVVGLVSGCVVVVAIKTALAGLHSFESSFITYIIHNWSYISELKQYGNMDFTFNLERIDVVTKLIAVGGVFVVSELVTGNVKHSDNFNIRSFRSIALFFAIPLVLFPEIISRYLFFYFGVEALFMCWAVSRPELRPRLACLIIFIASGFAPNAINILWGREWLYNFG